MSVVTSASATTRYYGLPIFEADDKPSYLTDWNGTMTEIDSLLKAQHDDIEANKGDILGLITRQNRLENALNSLDVIAQTLSDHLSLAEADIQTIKNTLIQIDTEVKNTSSRVTALTTRVDNLESRADGFDTSISGITSEVQEQESDITALGQTVGGHTTQIAGLSQDIDTVDSRALANTETLITVLGATKYSSSTTYEKGQYVYSIAPSNQIISYYQSKVDDNTGNSLSDDTKWRYVTNEGVLRKVLRNEEGIQKVNASLRYKSSDAFNEKVRGKINPHNLTKLTFPITFTQGKPAHVDEWGGTFNITATDLQGNTTVAGKVGFLNPASFANAGYVIAIGQITLSTIRNLFGGGYVRSMEFDLDSGVQRLPDEDWYSNAFAGSPYYLATDNLDQQMLVGDFDSFTNGFYSHNDVAADGKYTFVGAPFRLEKDGVSQPSVNIAPFNTFNTEGLLFVIELPFRYANTHGIDGTFTMNVTV